MAALANKASAAELDSNMQPAQEQAGSARTPGLQRGLGQALGLLTGALAALSAQLYKVVVEGAPYGSWRHRLAAYLALGPLRPQLLGWYARSGDHTRRLTSVRANAKFAAAASGPQAGGVTRAGDLAALMAAVKGRHGVRHVYAWHAMHGYWGGLAPDAPEMAAYQPRLAHPRPTPGVLELDPPFAWTQQVTAGVGLPPDMAPLYRDLHAYLAGVGVDGVKVDVQSSAGLFGSVAGGGPALAAAWQAALEASVAAHFPGNHCINCMCHSTENLYQMSGTAVARSSDDFWPRDAASHTTHVAVNAFNALFMGALLQPDWDMFHSLHPAGLLHATARVVSGGPLYVSDKPGRHDFGLLRRCVLPDGRVLRCRGVGRPARDCLFADVMRDGATLLKVWNVNAVGGVVAVFNVQGASWDRKQRRYHIHDARPPSLAARVTPRDIEGLAQRGQGQGPAASRQWLLYSERSRTAQLCGGDDPLSGMEVHLAPAQSELVTIMPVGQAGAATVAPVGLTNMLNAGAAVQQWHISQGSDGDWRVAVQLSAGGTFALFASAPPCRCQVQGRDVTYTYDQARQLVTCEAPADAGALEVVVHVPA